MIDTIMAFAPKKKPTLIDGNGQRKIPDTKQEKGIWSLTSRERDQISTPL
jgi:hypothetical protein